MAIRNRKLTSRLAHYQSEPAPIPRPTRRKRKNTFTAGGVVCLCVLCLLCYYGLSGTLTMPPESNKNRDASSYLIKPLVVGCYFTDDPQGIMAGSRIVRMRRLKIYDEDRYPSKRQMEWTKENEDNEAQLRDSRKYKRGLPQEREDEKCALRYEWQKRSYPTCNSIHETDFTEFYNDNGKVVDENSRIVASGFFRDVWKMSDNRDGISWIAAKTLRSIHPFTARNFDRHRRDALATERTSSSLHTLDMYSFCGHTVMTEFAEKGSLNDIIWPMNGNCTLSIKERLHYAMEVAKGLEALQFVDTPDAASIVHTDIRPAQLLLGGDNNSLKLNDFNRAFFIAFDRKTGSPCSFRVGNNPGKVSRHCSHMIIQHYLVFDVAYLIGCALSSVPIARRIQLF